MDNAGNIENPASPEADLNALNMSYEEEEYLDPGSQNDPLLSSFEEAPEEADVPEEEQNQQDENYSASSVQPEDISIVASRGSHTRNISISLSSKKYDRFQYHFVGVFYSRCFKTQHLADPVCTQDVYGSSIRKLLDCMWTVCRHYISKEVVVEQIDEEKHVRWSSKDTPDASDMRKFVVLKEGKTKKIFSIAELEENSRTVVKWRGKEIQVHVYKYSTSVTSSTIWDMINKKLLHPEKKDRAGAPSTEEVFDCIEQLKTTHSHYSALHSSWVKWANYILSQPGDRRPALMTEAPPDEYLHLFRAPPTSEGELLQATRQGLLVAHTMASSFKSSVNNLCQRVGSIAQALNELQLEVHELKAQVENSQKMLESMQASLPPQESEFSRKLASRVSDIPDIDHI